MRIRSVAISAAALITLSLGLGACSSAESAAPASQGPAVAVSVPATPQRVDAAAFANAVATPGVSIVDVRTPEEFAAGHIEGAVNFDVEGVDFSGQIATLDPAGTYAVYCRSGNRSQAAVAQMSAAGINGIYELSTGITGWAAAGYPTVS